MNYELANKLKDAGFPQKEVKQYPFVENYYSPTLTELIEACGRFFNRMDRNELTDGSVEWGAQCYDDEKGNSGYGSTPIEAVAHLWLSLNKKQ